MFIFRLKATTCTGRLSNGINSEQEKPETEKRENSKTYNMAHVTFEGFILLKFIY